MNLQSQEREIAKENCVYWDFCSSESVQTVVITLDSLFHSFCDNSPSYLHSGFSLFSSMFFTQSKFRWEGTLHYISLQNVTDAIRAM